MRIARRRMCTLSWDLRAEDICWLTTTSATWEGVAVGLVVRNVFTPVMASTNGIGLRWKLRGRMMLLVARI